MQPSTDDAIARPPLTRRLARLMSWFGQSRQWWALGIVTAMIAALTEPLIPALLKPLLDRGFTGKLQMWLVPVFVIGLFAVRGLAQFVSQYALARIANEGMQRLRRVLFESLLGAELALFTRQSASTLSNTVVYEVQTGAMLLVQALLGLSRDGFHAGGVADLPDLSELEAHADHRRADAGRGLDHEVLFQAALPLHAPRPAGHGRPGLRGGRERARPPHGAPARRRGRPDGPIRKAQREPEPAGREVDHRVRRDDTAHATARRGGHVDRGGDCAVAKR